MIRTYWPGFLEAAGAEPVSRTIAGVAVPWMRPGVVSDGTTVIFHPGSLDAAARPVALRDHDRTRPVGRVVDAADTGDRLTAAVAVSRVPLGDDSLILAADGALMFSVGAEPVQYSYDQQGRMHVYAADWQELSLLSIGAYPDAVVTSVAAGAPHPPTEETMLTDTDPAAVAAELAGLLLEDDTPTEPDPDTPDPDADPDAPADPDAVAPRVVPVVAATRGRRGVPVSPYRDVTLAQVARVLQASRAGNLRARALAGQILAAQGAVQRGIEAALVDVTLVGADNIGAMHRPAFQAELVDLISWGTPTIDILRQGDLERGDYPNKTFNTWVKTPEVDLQAAEKDPIHSAPVSIAPASVPVKTWAGGNDVSQQTLDFGSPSFVSDYIRAAGQDYALKSNTYATATLLAAAANVPTDAADSFIDIIGKLIAGLSPATTPPGGLFVAVAYDVMASMVNVTKDNAPAFWDGSITFGQMTPEMRNDAGLTVYVDTTLPARTLLGGHKQGATWYDLPGTPFTLQAVNVGLLGLDIAVYGYGALGIQYPGAFVKTTQPAPVP